MTDGVEIDGARGDGGGQILRTALALSIVTGRPLRMRNIRGKRPKPGLRRQHVVCVQAAAGICDGTFSPVEIGGTELEFVPGRVRPGTYRIDIETAGAVSLLLHALYLPLCLTERDSTLVLTGGTHVPWSPTFEYLKLCWAPNLERLGIHIELKLERAGFYPPGGGAVHAAIRGSAGPQPIRWDERVERPRWHGLSLQANLAPEVAARQREGALRVLRPALLDKGLVVPAAEEPLALGELRAYSPGTSIALVAEGTQCGACVTAVGERGKRAEAVGREAALAFAEHVTGGCPVDAHAADQLLLPLAMARAPSAFLTPRATAHLLANANTIEAFLPVRIRTEGAIQGGTRVLVAPA